jgi:hypothetical protein
VRDAVAGLSTLTNRTAQDVAAARADLSRLNAAADARASAAANSSAKGRDAEAEVEDLLTKSLPACDGWTVTRNNKTSHACDIEVRRTGHPLVRLEIKNKDVVNKLDVEKFQRDLSETTAHGVLVSLRCRVVGRSRALEFEPQPCGALAAYVCAQHADGGIDGDSIVSAVRAIHLVHERTVQRDDGEDGAFVAQVELDRLGEEMQGVFKGLKETRSDMEATKRMADKVIARTRTDLETALKRVVAIVLGEKVPDPAQAAATVAEGSCSGAGKAPPSRDDKAKAKRKPDSEKKFQCERCGSGYDQKKRFDTHLATCAMPLRVESEAGEKSSCPSEVVAGSRDSDVATGSLPPPSSCSRKRMDGRGCASTRRRTSLIWARCAGASSFWMVLGGQRCSRWIVSCVRMRKRLFSGTSSTGPPPKRSARRNVPKSHARLRSVARMARSRPGRRWCVWSGHAPVRGR